MRTELRPNATVTPEIPRRAFLRHGGAVVAAGAATGTVLWESEANAQGFGDGQTREIFRDIQRHENDHVTFLLQALGPSARPKPAFQNLLQRNRRDFFKVSQALENTGVGAYLGAAPVIFNRQNLAAAGSIALIEARHAGWLNTLLNARLTANVYGEEQSFERALTIDEVVALASPFIADLNGGPPLTFRPRHPPRTTSPSSTSRWPWNIWKRSSTTSTCRSSFVSGADDCG